MYNFVFYLLVENQFKFKDSMRNNVCTMGLFRISEYQNNIFFEMIYSECKCIACMYVCVLHVYICAVLMEAKEEGRCSGLELHRVVNCHEGVEN